MFLTGTAYGSNIVVAVSEAVVGVEIAVTGNDDVVVATGMRHWSLVVLRVPAVELLLLLSLSSGLNT